MACEMARILVKYKVETLDALSQASLGICIYIKDCRGSDVSNPLTLSNECDTPTYFKVETLEVSNG